MARIVLELRPLSFIIENVPGIKAGEVWQLDEAIKRLKKVYRLSEPDTLFAPDFGVPQTRKRVFVLGIRRDLGLTPEHPKPSHLPPGGVRTLFSPKLVTPTVRESIGDLPEVDLFPHLVNGDEVEYDKPPRTDFQRMMRTPSVLAARRGYSVRWDETRCTNCRRTQHGSDLAERLKALDVGQADAASGIRRLEPDGLGTTIRAGTTSERGSWSAPRPCHYESPRVLTTRECARLQTFPDWFRFHPVKWHGNRQVGNAVPVLLAESVGKALFAQLGLHFGNGSAPTIDRNDALITDDITKAEAARLDEKRITHQVVGTRKPGNSPRVERRSRMGQQ
jgi:DNA (cytosine-5)-methyltransferase 1